MSVTLPRETLRVLRFIHLHGPVPMNLCESKFGRSVRSRVVFLLDHEYIEHFNDKSELTFGRDLGYVSTDKGKNTLIDDHWLTVDRLRDSVVIPILVAWFTAWLATFGK